MEQANLTRPEGSALNDGLGPLPPLAWYNENHPRDSPWHLYPFPEEPMIVGSWVPIWTLAELYDHLEDAATAAEKGPNV